MPSERERQRLIDIRDHIILAQSFIVDMTFEQFTADRKTVFAAIRCLEIISEASRHIGPKVKERYPDLRWAQAAGAGNVYRHDYPAVRDKLVWITISSELPPLLAAVESEIAASAQRRTAIQD